jgi:two-component system, chemotaxis family, sensor kinase Cph1
MQNKALKETQLKLEDSRQEYFDLYDFAPTGYITLDKKGIILKSNLASETILGIERDRLYKRALIQYIKPKYRNKFNHHLMDVLEKGTKESIELNLIKMDENQCYVQLETTIVHDENGNFKEFRTTLTDITSRKETEEELRIRNARIHELLNVEIDEFEQAEFKLEKIIEKYKISNKDLKQFAYVSAHDLKAPLRMISTFLQLLKKKYEDQLDQNANDYINFAVDGAKRLDQMITDLLEYSDISRKEIQYSPLNLEYVLEKALEILKESIEGNNAIVTHDPLPIIKGDENLLIQLFQNLIGNAIKYRSEHTPRIHISAIKESNQYLFSIKDNGIGIDSKHLKRIFTIFQRLHGRDEYEGTGIGLSIAQKIINQHKGQIWAESEPGKCSTFYFTIPFKWI